MVNGYAQTKLHFMHVLPLGKTWEGGTLLNLLRKVVTARPLSYLKKQPYKRDGNQHLHDKELQKYLCC